MQPNECKHCGLHATWHIDDDTFFACGTIYAGRGDYWNESTGCVEIIQSRKRIQRAVEVLKSATRYTVENGRAKTLWWDTNPDGYVTDSKAVDEAIAILEGERDEA